MAKQWFVVSAFSGQEEKAVQLLREQIRNNGMEDSFGEICIPTEEVVELRKGQKQKSTRHFFPGYFLVHMDMDDVSWHLVKSNPKIIGFVGGTSDKPAAIPESEAHAIMKRIEAGVDNPRPKILFEPGEMVRVTDGPFSDFNGVVEEVNYEKNRLVVSVLIFGRSTPVDLDFSQVEKN